jgi:hypothetical protein
VDEEGSLDRAFRNTEHWLTKKTTEWKPIVFRPKGRPEMRWKDDVKND